MVLGCEDGIKDSKNMIIFLFQNNHRSYSVENEEHIGTLEKAELAQGGQLGS